MAAKRSIDQLVVVTGTLAAEQEIVLGMKVSGRLAEVSVDLGSAVQKDQPVARLDTTDFQLRVRQADAALQQARVRLGLPPDGESEDIELEQTNGVRQARAQMDAARNHLDRMMLLLEKGLVPKTDVNDANLRFKVADAQYADSLDEARNRQAILAQRRSELEIARQQLADAVLYAPISGMVRQRSANVGQYLVAGAPIVTLVQMNPLRLQTAVPEREARSIRTGQSVHVTVEGAPGVHQGRVARISPSFDEANRTLLVETEVSNAANILRPGAFSRAEIVVSSGQQALMVPPSSLATFAGIDRVFTVKDGKASERRVKTGRRTEEGVEILEGISAGDEVVVSPGNIADGENVAVKR
jgi:RND family efflux transporter MFP subunit